MNILSIGLITGVVDTDGQVVNRYVYTPDGEDTETCPTGDCVDNPWRFAGEHLDEVTGMYKIGERYYQPDQAVWTQPDPLEGRINPAQPGETNPYAYAGCNPINYTDPTGLCVGDFVRAGLSTVALGLSAASFPEPVTTASGASIAAVSLSYGLAVDQTARAFGCVGGGI